MISLKKHFPRQLLFIFTFIFICSMLLIQTESVQAARKDDPFPYVFLSAYHKSIPIDGECLLIAITSNGRLPTFRSSNSSIASVNTYGVVTGKKSGTCKITAKIKGAESSCRITVEKSTISLSRSAATLENGASLTLSATVSTGHDVTWKSESSAIARVDEDGVVTAKKCGSTVIRATADGVTAKCKITVKKPDLTVNRSKLTLYPEDTFQLVTTCSSERPITFRSSSSAVAAVDENGLITARKKGVATITAKVDGVSRTCKVTVLAAKSDS